MNDLLLRVISGFVLAVVVIAAVIYLPSPFFKIGVSFVSSVAVWEVSNLLRKKLPYLSPEITAFVGFISSISLLFLSSYLSVLIIFLYAFYVAHRNYNIDYLNALIFSLVYGVFFVSSIGILHQLNKYILFVLFATVWSVDILAYFVGKSIGKNKLAPKLSPKKTWEGAIGGFLGGTIIGGLTSYYLGIYDAYIPVVLTAVIGQIGDLFESFIKRQVGEKDSSHIIPGHGGILDRIDALIFGSVIFLIYYQIRFILNI